MYDTRQSDKPIAAAQSRFEATWRRTPLHVRLDGAQLTADFTPRLDILPPPQRRLWDELAVVPGEFVLYGGTALALHLGHRESLDFDFFGNKPLDPAKLVPAASFLVGAIVTQREPNTFSCTIDRGGVVKLSFFLDYQAFRGYRRR